MWRPFGCYHNYYTGTALNQCFVRPPARRAYTFVRCVPFAGNAAYTTPPMPDHMPDHFSATVPQSQLERVKFIGESTLGESFAQFQIHLNRSNYYWPEKQTVPETKVVRSGAEFIFLAVELDFACRLLNLIIKQSLQVFARPSMLRGQGLHGATEQF